MRSGKMAKEKEKSRAKRLQYSLHFLIVAPAGFRLASTRMGTRTDGRRWGVVGVAVSSGNLGINN